MIIKTEKSLLKQAEQNAVNRAKEMTDMLQVVDALAGAGSRMFTLPDQVSDFSQGLKLIRKAFYAKYTQAIVDCFTFVGVGGEEAAKYSREAFESLFDEEERFCVMRLLENYGNVPHSYQTSEDQALRNEAREALKDVK